MRVSITDQGFLLDTRWTPEQHQAIVQTMASWKTFRYHNIILTDRNGKTVRSNGCNDPHVVLRGLDHFGFPQDLTGKTVLDIGCNLGFYAFAAKLRGAKKVVGFDISPDYIQEASYLRDQLGFSADEVEFRAQDGNNLARQGEQFDVVINVGVLYHIENPVFFLRQVSEVTREMMLLESEMLIDSTYTEYSWFIEKEYGSDPTNWWIYGPKCLERMARAAGFPTVKFEGFLWKPEPGTKTPEGFMRQGRGVLTCSKKA